ncbi:response regulator [Pseudoflavonifractor sp. MSJ-37]|uniref:response regulator n=1 Tax=Pseudoflavonifractor sp. MSJ-37 TaxID=2841531 RepID=UPI001C125D00|nr:response regulator [Pseudoflavonifractor sp. MSJ-37]MBU5434690.1 response regulator [Pseudoflavonifractor sp. MSJ-37]
MYRVIIVEDDPDIARSTKRSVEKEADFQVTAIFSNGQEALNYIWLDPVDLIVLDLFMPQMNGKEFLYRLRKEDLRTEVIVVTGDNDAGNIRDALPFGIVDYLLKPFTAARFSEALERFVQRHQIINAMGGLDQSGIDAMFSDPAQHSEASRLARLEERGLDPAAYQAILDFMDAAPDTGLTAEELAKAGGLSKVAVRRYLNEMLEAKHIVSGVEMGGGPRPVMRYRRPEEGRP